MGQKKAGQDQSTLRQEWSARDLSKDLFCLFLVVEDESLIKTDSGGSSGGYD